MRRPTYDLRPFRRAVWVRSGWGLALMLLVLLGSGCARDSGQTRSFVISAWPSDATIHIDGVERGRGPLTEGFFFVDKESTHQVMASRFGYRDEVVTIGQDYAEGNVHLILRPRTRRVTFVVEPTPAIVSVDGKPLSSEPVGHITTDLEFRLDPQDRWVPHTVSAERAGYARVDQKVSWEDQKQDYVLSMRRLSKDLVITSEPPGASVHINDEPYGPAPVRHEAFEPKLDSATGRPLPVKLSATKAGWLPAEQLVQWDDEQSEFKLVLKPRSKLVRVVTEPPGGIVTIGGKDLPRDEAGVSSTTLEFPPVDDRGIDYKMYDATAAPKPADTGRWEAVPFTIAWDNGREEYKVALRESTSRPLELVRPRVTQAEGRWTIKAERLSTTAARDTAEPGTAQPQLVVRAPEGGVIGSLATSPDGSQIVYTVLSTTPEGALLSRLWLVPADGVTPPRAIGDEAGLSLAPAFMPDGRGILFSSDRGGDGVAVWLLPLRRGDDAKPVRVTNAKNAVDLWPNLDSAPRPRLFFERWADGAEGPRLFAAPQNGARDDAQDLKQPGVQPRVSPTSDRVLFALADPATGRRDIRTIATDGEAGAPANVTRSPAYDEFDAVWSRDGSRIAFVSNRPAGAAGAAGDLNVWLLELDRPGAPLIQVTANESHDDSPTWDAVGNTVYFRSNRGGEWGIWKIAVK